MVDKFTSAKRHEIMSKIRGKDTKIELKVRKWIYHHGIRYRKNYSALFGSPDIAITKSKIAIFVNGCFWHGHDNCKLYSIPKTRTDFWTEKISKNKIRDSRNIENLEAIGWIVLVLWECQLGNDFDNTMESVLKVINDTRNGEIKKIIDNAEI